MQFPITFMVAPVVLAITTLVHPSDLQGQAPAERAVSPTAARVGVLSWKRAIHWASAGPVIHCGPAPLTERPGAAAELARPRVAPLEAAFLDAATVKRTLAARPPSAWSKP
jgi:hypothetical protein